MCVLIKVVQDTIVKKKFKGITENGYFQYKGFVSKTSSELLEIHKGDDIVQILLTYYPIKENKPIVLLDNINNYPTVKRLENAINRVINWLSEACIEGISIDINYAINGLEVRDKNSNLLYVLKV